VRKVKKDNTFSFLGRRYETPVDLRDREIQLRYDRSRTDAAGIFIYFKGQRLGAARLLDAVANGLARRKPPQAVRQELPLQESKERVRPFPHQAPQEEQP
jgi:hypothetical protein